MTYTFKLARRLAILRNCGVLAVLALLAACLKDMTAPESHSNDSAAIPSFLQVIPSKVTVETNQRVRFRSRDRRIEVDWAATGGTINVDGTFSSSTAGTFKVVGRGHGRKQADTSTVVVVPPPADLVSLVVTPGSTTLDPGATRAFTVTGYLSDGSTAPVGVTWSATGGTVDPSGVYTAGQTSGVYRVIATHTSDTLADTAAITINAPQLVSVVVSPVSVTLTEGQSKQFKAYGRNSAGDSVAVTASFSATGGTITSGGLYTAAQTAGTYRVVATASSLADTAAVSVASTSAGATTTSGKVGVPFGPFGSWSSAALQANTAEFNLSQDATTASVILDRIAAARSHGVQLMLAMTGGSHSQYLTDGVFDRAKWEARMATFNTAAIRQAVASAVSDGVIVGNNVMDEPFHPSWGGTMTKARVDSLCADVKAIFPTLPVGPTHDHDDFEPTKSYYVCDFILSQYRTAKGDVTAFRDAGLALAARDHHSIAFSMNILDGGTPDRDGTWDCAGTGGKGTYSPNCRMTPEQIRTYGRVLGPAGCAMLMWRYDDTFMANSENVLAFKDIAALLANSQRKSCSRP
jgi:hypothetical protein